MPGCVIVEIVELDALSNLVCELAAEGCSTFLDFVGMDFGRFLSIVGNSWYLPSHLLCYFLDQI